MKFFKKTIREIGHHAGVLVRGICRVVYGAWITTGIIVGVRGLTIVSAVEGWHAVLLFASSLFCLLSSVISVYLTGLYVERGAGK